MRQQGRYRGGRWQSQWNSPALGRVVSRDIAGDIAVDIGTDDAVVWMTYETLAERR
jgi:hypothetical protein